MILLGLKGVFRINADVRRNEAFPPFHGQGCYGSTVGIVSLSTIGRLVLNFLKPFDLQVIAYDPFVSSEEARALGVTLVSLDEIFRQGDVVSIHTPLLKETDGMITGQHVAAMKQYATFINTARGGIVRETEMIDVLRRRPDLQVILDVTSPEPPIKGSPLYSLPNVTLTPHIAGSRDSECRRLGQSMVSELRRFVNHEPLQWAVTKESTRYSTHRPQRHA